MTVIRLLNRFDNLILLQNCRSYNLIHCIVTLCTVILRAGTWMREPGENPGHCQNAVYARGCRL